MDATQARERSRRIAGVFDRAAQDYDHVGVDWFTPIAHRLVQEIAPRTGERALDVGTGRGAALFPLAEAVRPDGTVTGIDLAAGMVSATRDELRSRRLTNVELLVMDASAPDLPPASFDLVACSLVIFFLPDPLAALQAWHELLVPGGRIGLTTFGAATPGWGAADQVFRPYLPQEMVEARTSGAVNHFADDESVARLVRSAGFDGVRTVTAPFEVVFASLDQWYAWSWSHGQRALWELVPDGELPAVRAAVGDALAPLRRSDGSLPLRQDVRFTMASRPA